MKILVHLKGNKKGKENKGEMKQILKNRYIVDLNPNISVISLNANMILHVREKYQTRLKKPQRYLKETHIKPKKQKSQ